jgi:hypothetical protein
MPSLIKPGNHHNKINLYQAIICNFPPALPLLFRDNIRIRLPPKIQMTYLLEAVPVLGPGKLKNRNPGSVL